VGSRSRARAFSEAAALFLLTLAGAALFALGWLQQQQTSAELTSHVHHNCLVDARTADSRRALDQALLDGDVRELAADRAAVRLHGTPQSRAELAAHIRYLTAAIGARRADLAVTPAQPASACRSARP
jgi:hypothetical protein